MGTLMPVSSLRRWLRRTPHPVKLRADGRDVAIATGTGMWARTEETIVALNPVKVEALDANGMVLRVLSLDGTEEEEKEEVRAKESEVVSLARIIAEAHDAGAQRHAEAYRMAFGEFSRLVQTLTDRLTSLETAWWKAMQTTARAQADAIMAQAHTSESSDPAGTAVVGMLTQAMMSKGSPVKEPPEQNGAKGAKR